MEGHKKTAVEIAADKKKAVEYANKRISKKLDLLEAEERRKRKENIIAELAEIKAAKEKKAKLKAESKAKIAILNAELTEIKAQKAQDAETKARAAEIAKENHNMLQLNPSKSCLCKDSAYSFPSR